MARARESQTSQTWTKLAPRRTKSYSRNIMFARIKSFFTDSQSAQVPFYLNEGRLLNSQSLSPDDWSSNKSRLRRRCASLALVFRLPSSVPHGKENMVFWRFQKVINWDHGARSYTVNCCNLVPGRLPDNSKKDQFVAVQIAAVNWQLQYSIITILVSRKCNAWGVRLWWFTGQRTR